MIRENPYKPVKAEITKIIPETPNIKTFKLKLAEPLEFSTGQFIQLTVPGIGEAPFTPSSQPGKHKNIDVTVMKVGAATEKLHDKQVGEILGVRGPYGNGFPVDRLQNRELLIVGGGCGIAPLRSLIYEILGDRNKYPKVHLLYGCKSPRDVIYKDTYDDWSDEFIMHRTVDEPDESWEEDEGVVTTLFDKVDVDTDNCLAVVVGPPVMMKFGCMELEEMGITADRIIISLEKNMTCGFGKCRHCLVGPYYVCKDGPVFTYDTVKGLPGLWD
ncbi:MAG: FAD/NAD(P)-binding protein [Elusimicrobiota bacterium]